MSVKVDLDQLADALADFTFAYLITVGDDYRAHTVAVEPVLSDGALDVGPVGNSTRQESRAARRRHAGVATERARRLHTDHRRHRPHRTRRADRHAESRGAASESVAGHRDQTRLQGRLRAARRLMPRRAWTRVTAVSENRAGNPRSAMGRTKKPGSQREPGFLVEPGLRSPCRPCHRSGRPRVRTPSPACRRRRPRWSGTAPRWTPRSAAPNASP